MASFVNILFVTSDHSLYKEHVRKVVPTYHKYLNIVLHKFNWHNLATFKICLSVLYSIVWIWGLTGKVLYSIVWIWGLTGKVLYSIVWIWGLTGKVLYSIVWIWGLTGKVLYSIVWIWGLTGNSFVQHCVDMGFNR